MKRWFASNVVSSEEFETHQLRLTRLSKDVLRRYSRDLESELADPERIAAIYGSGFVTDSFKARAENVALTATNALDVPNSDVSYVLEDRHQAIASVRDGRVAEPGTFDVVDSLCKNVIATGREFATEMAANHPLVCDTSWARDGDIVSYLGVPVSEPQGKIVGVLCVWTSAERHWTVSDVDVLTQLSFTLTRFLQAQ